MTIVLALLALGGSPLSLDGHATVRTHFAGLSKEGETYKAARSLEDSIVYARFEGRPAEEVRARFAQVLHATWTQPAPGVWMLARNEGDLRRVTEIERAHAARQIELRLAELPKPSELASEAIARDYIRALEVDLAKTGATPPAFAGPLEGLLNDLLRSLGSEWLAELPAYRNVALSDVPTIRERPLPRSTRPAIARYREVESAFAELLTEELAQRLDDWTRVRLREGTRQVGTSRILLHLQRNDHWVGAIVATYDLNGRLRAAANTTIRLARAEDAGSDGREVSVGDLAAREALVAPGSSPEPLKKYLDPARYDPLELRVLPVLREMRGPTLWVLPDQSVPETAPLTVRSESQFLAAMVRAGVESRKEAGWNLGILRNPAIQERKSLNREVLSRYIARGGTSDLAGLRATALFWNATWPTATSSGLYSFFVRDLLPKLEGSSRDETVPRSFLRAIGALSDKEWGQLTDGQAITIRAGSEAGEALDDWTTQGIRTLNRREGAAVTDVKLTGTAAFPTGLPIGTQLTMTRSDESVILNRLGYWVPIEDTVFDLYPPGKTLNVADDDGIARLAGDTRFAEARRSVYTFRADFDRSLFTEATMEADDFREIRRDLTYKQLSDSTRQKYREILVRWKEERAKLRLRP